MTSYNNNNEESLCLRSFPSNAEQVLRTGEPVGYSANATSGGGSTSANSPAASTSIKIGNTMPMVVNATSSSTISTVLSPPPIQNNKKHSLGYRIRRLIFPQFCSTTGTTLSKHKASKELENNENQVMLFFCMFRLLSPTIGVFFLEFS